MINLTPRLAQKNRKDWGLGMPHAQPLDLTAAEQVFLNNYADHGDRLMALAQAGLRTATAADDQATANAILAKIAILPMAEIATALGGDRVRYLANLLQAFTQPQQHQDWRTAATLLGKIHGLWDAQAPGQGQTILVIQAPTCPNCGHEHSATPTLPFAVPQEISAKRALEVSGETLDHDHEDR